MPSFEVLKDADAVLDYTIDWSDVFPADDPIVVSAWACDEGITIVAGAASNTDTTTTVWLEDGDAGSWYDVTNHVTTSQDREDDRTIRVFVYEA